MFTKKTVILCSTLVATGLSFPLLFGQAAAPAAVGASADGIYSADQAKRGEALYQKQCVSCHGAGLDGAGPYPALSGDEFLTKYAGQPAGNLYDMIQKLMPATAPGSLTRPEAGDLTAYVLSFNKLPAGKADMTTDEEALKKAANPEACAKELTQCV